MVWAWKTESIDTRVTFTLAQVADGTRLRLDHAGFAGMKGIMISFILGSGWKGIVHTHLPKVIEGLRPAAATSGPASSGEGREPRP